MKCKVTVDTSHYPKEGPWELPKGWIWSTLGEVSDYGNCITVPVSAIKDEEWVLELEDIEKDTGRLLKRIAKRKRSINGSRHAFSGGQVLFSKLRTYLNKVLVAPSDGYCTTEIIPISPQSGVVPEYLNLVLRSPYFLDYTEQCGYGVKMPRLGTSDAIKAFIPIPPYEEQHRIVEFVDNYTDIVERIQSEKEDLVEYVSRCKSQILDVAIHGKLVPQDPSDEPAITLLQRINPSFKTTDNLHYEEFIPGRWCVAPLSSFCTTINGLWKGNKEPLVYVGVFRNANFTKDFGLDYSKIEYIDVELKSFEKRNLEDGDIIVEKSGGSDNFPVGRSILFKGESKKYAFSNFTMSLRILDKNLIRPKYLYYVLQHKYRRGDMKQMQTQTTGLHNLLTDKFLSSLIPIPPVQEQEKIVSAVENLFQTVDGIRDLVYDGQ